VVGAFLSFSRRFRARGDLQWPVNARRFRFRGQILAHPDQEPPRGLNLIPAFPMTAAIPRGLLATRMSGPRSDSSTVLCRPAVGFFILARNRTSHARPHRRLHILRGERRVGVRASEGDMWLTAATLWQAPYGDHHAVPQPGQPRRRPARPPGDLPVVDEEAALSVSRAGRSWPRPTPRTSTQRPRPDEDGLPTFLTPTFTDGNRTSPGEWGRAPPCRSGASSAC